MAKLFPFDFLRDTLDPVIDAGSHPLSNFAPNGARRINVRAINLSDLRGHVPIFVGKEIDVHDVFRELFHIVRIHRESLEYRSKLQFQTTQRPC